MRCSSDRAASAVVFDLDDTLYLERDYVLSGLQAVDGWARAQLGLEGLGERMRARFAVGERTRLFDRALADLGRDAPPALIARMLGVYRQHRPLIALAPDALAWLRSPPAGTAVAVITDGWLDAQKRKVRALGLHRLGVRVAVCTDRWGRAAWKPSPRAFLHVQAALGLAPERLTYVGDNPDKDFHAPARLGWRTVRVARADGLHRDATCADVAPDRVIVSLAEM